MKVSVLMTTYNQEGYIAEAIESILAQDVNFDYEIVIGEDASTDNTLAIVNGYSQRYPDKVRVLQRARDVAERDRQLGRGGKTSFLDGFKVCQGEYIALLDGDDYYTSKDKLQKQADFLDSHPDFTICFHNAQVVYENADTPPHAFCPPDQKATSTVKDLLSGNIMLTCSVMFRNHTVERLPDWYLTTRVGDWPLHVLHAKAGKIGYLDEVMATYRVHDKGFLIATGYEDKVLEVLSLLDSFDEYLDHKYSSTIRATKYKFHDQLIAARVGTHDVAGAKKALLTQIKLGLMNYRPPSRQQLVQVLKWQSPGLYAVGEEWLRSLGRVLKRTRKIEVPASQLQASEPNGLIRDGGQMTVRTPATMWAYGATLDLSTVAKAAKVTSGELRVRAQVTGARVGIGVLDSGGQDYLDRVEVRPGARMTSTYLRIADLSKAGSLVIQTWDEAVSAKVTVKDVTLFVDSG